MKPFCRWVSMRTIYKDENSARQVSDKRTLYLDKRSSSNQQFNLIQAGLRPPPPILVGYPGPSGVTDHQGLGSGSPGTITKYERSIRRPQVDRTQRESVPIGDHPVFHLRLNSLEDGLIWLSLRWPVPYSAPEEPSIAPDSEEI